MRKPCVWKQEQEDGACWDTNCGRVYVLEEGLPSEYGIVYCCYCGGKVIEAVWCPDFEE